MASPEWLEIYRNYDDAKLDQEIAEIEAEKSVYTSQGVGNKNYTKDLSEIRGRLSSAYRVKSERKHPVNQSVGQVDFSRL
ncbi:MAG: hypothetical protein V4710_04765 [Verrucomicrobiota bacterium]